MATGKAKIKCVRFDFSLFFLLCDNFDYSQTFLVPVPFLQRLPVATIMLNNKQLYNLSNIISIYCSLWSQLGIGILLILAGLAKVASAGAIDFARCLSSSGI